jgi:hypothetical protein
MVGPRHRADAIFTLPRLPATVALLGDLPGWADDLRERRIELVGAEESPDAVVAEAARVDEAVALAAPSIVVNGRVSIATSLDSAVRRLLPLPVAGEPALFFDLEQRRAPRYGIRHGIVHPQRWRTLRNRAASQLAGHGLLPAPSAAMTVASARGAPELLAAAAEAGGLDGPEWLLLVSSGSIVRRDAFLLFPPREALPAQVVKFSRAPGPPLQFERDERAARLVSATGGAVARHAPAFLGRFEVAGRPASLETAAPGTKLTNLLREPRPRRAKLAVVEPVAQWLISIARETAAPPEALVPERERLARDLGRDVLESVPPVPATFLHNDVGEENVVASADGFMVLDWEWAQPHGLPLSDLVYFGVHVLRIVDRALTEEERDRHFVDVLAGKAESSPVLFRWVRELVAALELPPESVGPLVTASWLDHGRLSLVERRRAEAAGDGRLDPAFAERAAEAWMREPALGPGWNAWR